MTDPISYCDKSILLAQHPWQTPFLTVTSWFLELCTRERPISHVNNTIVCSPDPWQSHFSPWQVYIICTTPCDRPISYHVTNWFLELCTRDRTISHFKNTIFCFTDPWQPHFSPWQVYIISTTPVTDPFLTVISWVMELCTRDRTISHFINTIFFSPHPWQPYFSPWQVYNVSTTPVTDPISHHDKLVLEGLYTWQTHFSRQKYHSL